MMLASALNVVVAFIQPSRLDQVLHAVRRIPHFPGLSVTEVRGFGSHARPQGDSEPWPFEPCLRLEVYCRPAEVVVILESIRRAAHTGAVGDGKVFAAPVTLACRIGSGEWGEKAVMPVPAARSSPARG